MDWADQIVTVAFSASLVLIVDAAMEGWLWHRNPGAIAFGCLYVLIACVVVMLVGLVIEVCRGTNG